MEITESSKSSHLYMRPHVKLFVEFLIMQVMSAIDEEATDLKHCLSDITKAKSVLEGTHFTPNTIGNISKTPHRHPALITPIDMHTSAHNTLIAVHFPRKLTKQSSLLCDLFVDP